MRLDGPEYGELTIQFVEQLDLLHGALDHGFTEPKVEAILREFNQPILAAWFQHQLLMQHSLIRGLHPFTLQVADMYIAVPHEPTLSLHIGCPRLLRLDPDQLVHLHDVGVLHVLEIHLTELALDDTSSEVVDVVLLQRDGFDEQIVTRANHIQHQDLVVACDGKYTFIVADRGAGREAHDDPLQTLSWYDASVLAQGEDVAWFSIELVAGGQLGIVMDRQQLGGLITDLDLVEVDGVITQVYLEGCSCTITIKV